MSTVDRERNLFLLPRALLSFVLEYLTRKEIAVLDTSVSENLSRLGFLDCLTNSKPIDVKSYDTSGEITWLSRRQIPVRSAVLLRSIDSTVKLSSLHSVIVHDVDDLSMLWLVTNNPGMRSISIHAKGYHETGEMPYVVTGASIEFGVAAHCRNLETFSYHFHFDDGEIKHPSINRNIWLSMFRRCERLKTVSLVAETLWGLRDTDLCLLCEFGHLFEKLHFRFGDVKDKMTEIGVIHFLNACPNLIELGIVSKSPSTSVFQCSQKLEKLKLNLDGGKLSTEHLLAIRNNYKALRHLSLCKIKSVTSATMENICRIEMLEELKIADCELKDALIATLARSMDKLRRLQLSYDSSSNFTPDCFMALDGSPMSRSLEQICLIITSASDEEDGQAGLTAAGFSVFHNLQKIVIKSLWDTDVKECALELEILNLWSAGCPNQQEVDFSPAETLTVEDLIQFVKSCCHLSKIVLWYVRKERRDYFLNGMKDNGWSGKLEFREYEGWPHCFANEFVENLV